MSTVPVYSPLCDVSPFVYFKYLAACCYGAHVCGAEASGCERCAASARLGESWGVDCSAGVGSGLQALALRRDSVGGAWAGSVLPGSPVVGESTSVDGCVVEVSEPAGVAGVGEVGVVVDESGVSSTGASARSGGPAVELGDGGCEGVSPGVCDVGCSVDVGRGSVRASSGVSDGDVKYSVRGDAAEVKCGKNHVKNVKKRQRRRAARLVGEVTSDSEVSQVASVQVGVPEWRKGAGPACVCMRRGCKSNSDLCKSLAAKWVAQNKAEELKAEQHLRLLQARDLEKVQRMQAAQVVRTTERCLAETEKAYAFLAKTGNVPGLPGGGFAETVLSGDRSSGQTISPDSSVSMKEFMECQKKLLDTENEIEKLRKQLEKALKLVPLEDLEKVVPAGPAVTTHYSLDSQGRLPGHAPSLILGGYDNGRGQFRLSNPSTLADENEFFGSWRDSIRQAIPG